MVVSPLWRGLGNIQGVALDGKSYRQGQATAQTPTVTAASGVMIAALLFERATSLLSRAVGGALAPLRVK